MRRIAALVVDRLSRRRWSTKTLLVAALAAAGLALPGSALAGKGLSVSDHHYNFGSCTDPCGIATAHTFYFTNTTNNTIFVNTTNPGAPFFVFSSNCAAHLLGAGAACAVVVYFDSGTTGPGTFRASLVVTGDNGGSAKVGLVGTAT